MKCRILMYHRVSNNKIPILPNNSQMNVTPDNFDQQIQYLKEKYTIISLSELINLIQQKKSTNNKVSITFDDGFLDNYTEAFPILKKHNVPAAIFIITGFLKNPIWTHKLYYLINKLGWGTIKKDLEAALKKELTDLNNALEMISKSLSIEQRDNLFNNLNKKYNLTTPSFYLTKEHIKELANNNIEIGFHTHSHSYLGSLSDQDQEKDILGGKKLLEEITGNPVTLFAYPWGNKNSFNKKTIEILKQEDFTAAVTTINGNIIDNLFTLPRYSAINRGRRTFALSIEKPWLMKIAKKLR